MKLMGMHDYLTAGKALQASRIYNGFTWEERIAVNAVQRTRRRRDNPTVCSISGYSAPHDLKGSGYIFTHLEDYRRALEWLPVGKRAHRLLHARFTNPREWFDFVAANYVHGAWWTMLVMSPIQCGRQFDRCYPVGLPMHDERWEDFATAAGISRELFTARDIREPIRALWKFPVVAKPAPVEIAPPARRRVAT